MRRDDVLFLLGARDPSTLEGSRDAIQSRDEHFVLWIDYTLEPGSQKDAAIEGKVARLGMRVRCEGAPLLVALRLQRRARCSQDDVGLSIRSLARPSWATRTGRSV